MHFRSLSALFVELIEQRVDDARGHVAAALASAGDYVRNRLPHYHFLGLDYEREVRKHYFICNAGIYVAAITSTGDITSCLDIERRPETVFGNILTDRLKDVWENGFQIFRGGLAEKSEKCRTCSQLEFCAGGACHSWDYDKNEQRMCFKDVLF